MKSYFLTFVVPIYKIKTSQLNRCVQSILHQIENKQDYEILLVDDGSPDECPMICDKYAEKYDNVRVIHQKNQGLSVVRNNGVNAAQGNWVAFVDADDWIEKDFVFTAEEAIMEGPADCDIFIWDGFSETETESTPIRFLNTSVAELQIFKSAEKEKLIDKIIPRYVRAEDIDKCTDIGITWGRIYRRDFLCDNHIDNVPGLSVMQDSVFNLWAFEYARTICYQYKPLYHYSMYDGSISKKYDCNISETMRSLYGYFAGYIKECHDSEEYWQRLYVRTIRLLVKCLAKDYANPQNPDPLQIRVKKMKKDLEAEEFQTAITMCSGQGQEFKFRVILFLLKHQFYGGAISVSKAFGDLRRLKNKVS